MLRQSRAVTALQRLQIVLCGNKGKRGKSALLNKTLDSRRRGNDVCWLQILRRYLTELEFTLPLPLPSREGRLDGRQTSYVYDTDGRLIKTIDCNGNTMIGRERYPLLCQAGINSGNASSRMVYVDTGKPDLIEGFMKKIFTAIWNIEVSYE